MTVGGLIDWLLSNSVAIGSVVAFILLIVKVSRKLDKIQTSQSTVTADVKSLKESNSTLTETLTETTTKLTGLESTLTSIADRLKVCEDTIANSQKDRSSMRSLIDDLKKEVSTLETCREEDAGRIMITLQSIRASLVGLIEVGANGPVKQALAELDSYLFKKGSV